MFFCHTHSASIFHHEMWALIDWVDAVTKRGGRVLLLLSVQLFDSLEPGYKRMLSPQLRQMQPRMGVSLYVIVAWPIPKKHTYILNFKEVILAGQDAS